MDFKKLVERGELVKKERFAKVIASNKEKLEELLKGVNEDNHHKEIDFGTEGNEKI